MQFIRKNLKPILLIIVIAFVVSIFYGLGQYRSSGNRPQNTGNLIAQVNDTGISYQQWQNAFSNFVSRYDNQMLSDMPDETLASIKNSITDQLVNSTLLYQYGKDLNLNIPASQTNEELGKIKDSFDSEKDFNEALKQNNLTVSQLKDNINRQLMIEKAMEQEYEKIEITEEELSEYYEENKDFFFEPEKRKIRHILVENKSDAEIILNQLNDGIADFDQLAREKSIGPSSEKGGDLGYITRGQMVKEFEEAAFALEIDQISEIVQTEYGYHILICDDITEEHQMGFEEAKDTILNILTSQRQNKAIEALITRLREDATITTYYDFTSELKTSEQTQETPQITTQSDSPDQESEPTEEITVSESQTETE